MDSYYLHYEKTVLSDDFDIEIDENHIECSCDNCNLKSLPDINCYENPDNLTCTNLILTN